MPAAATKTPASIDDHYHLCEDGQTHLFPKSGGPCLCGRHGAKKKGERCPFGRSGAAHPFCAACKRLQDRRMGAWVRK